jgi:oligopeptide/dipeptide ABC transporter ATP-binding protein
VSEPLLLVEDLRVSFPTDQGESRPVDGVSLEIRPGETLGLVGESGCGKSLTALSILGLIPSPPSRTLPGSSVRLRGEELLGAPPARLRAIRGAEIAMIFQEPMTSLNPVHRVGDQIAEAVGVHRRVDRRELRAEVLGLLDRVGMSDPERARRSYPHELSGGMQQRAMIAMAVACKPTLLIADEPTTALDVTIQAQILELLASLQRDFDMALLFISHDMAVVSQVADRVAVMYAGEVVEEAATSELFLRPAHPYTEGLLRAVPSVDAPKNLTVIAGRVPHPTRWPAACRFHPRCPYRWERCGEEAPPLLAVGPARARCWLAEEPGRRARSALDGAPS